MKNTITLSLIIVSIILLLALQVFWLQSAYEKAFYTLKRETNSIFRNTVFQLRDSVFVNMIHPFEDSLYITSNGITKRRVEITEMRNNFKPDSLVIRRQPSTVQVYISSSGTNDSILKSLTPIATKIQSLNSSKQSFTIRIAADSLNTDSLEFYFQKNLIKSSIKVATAIKQIDVADFPFSTPNHSIAGGEMRWRTEYHEQTKAPNILRDTLETESVRLNPGRRYSASLIGVQKILLREITPQVFFSVFLTAIIISAFVVMYRNMRSQQRLIILKNDFISNITHELKTPVATVSVALEALQNFGMTSDPKRSQEYLAMAQSELSRLSTMTDEILKTTVFEEKGIQIENENVNLKEIMDNAIRSLKLLIDKSAATLTTENVGEDFTLIGSGLHLTNMVSNLMENAIKYSVEKPVIHVNLQRGSNHIQLSVKDQGIGIAHEYQKKVFEKFFRVPTGNIHTIKGYGLGLSYVANVVKAHHGTITLKSERDKGSEFIVTLPINSKHS